MVLFSCFETPMGTMTVYEEEGQISFLSYGKPPFIEGKPPFNGGKLPFVGEKEGRSPVITQTIHQLTMYFQKERKTFDLPLCFHGTPFQKSVWEALLSIPYGETRTYGEIAKQIGKPNACRAVGMANKRNPLAIVVPCHRVIGKNGTLTGYNGGMAKKEALLALEKQKSTEK